MEAPDAVGDVSSVVSAKLRADMRVGDANDCFEFVRVVNEAFFRLEVSRRAADREFFPANVEACLKFGITEFLYLDLIQIPA